MSSFILYGITIILLLVSIYKDKRKTKMALKKAWKAFENILPQILVIMLLVGLMLSFFNADTISTIIGTESGIAGVIISAVIGAITLIPGFVAFPTAAMLLESGAGYMQIAAFVSTLMMVGVITFPIERKYFGLKLTILRNVFSFFFSFFIAYFIGIIMSL